jgi:acetyltransferase
MRGRHVCVRALDSSWRAARSGLARIASIMATKADSEYLAGLTSSYSPIYGQAISIRPMQPEDLDIETAFVESWSPETRYNRVFSAGSYTSPERLKQLTRIDYTRDMALIATLMLDDKEVQIGVARYVLRADNKTCEFALTVADAWQHRGIGRALMQRLLEGAAAAGVETMEGEILASNAPMLHFMRSLGFTVRSTVDGPEIRHVSKRLSPAAAGPAGSG